MIAAGGSGRAARTTGPGGASTPGRGPRRRFGSARLAPAPLGPSTRPATERRRDSIPSAVLRGSLEHGMLVCLGLLASPDPNGFEAAAVAWHARLCHELPGCSFDESGIALSALESLAGPEPRPAAAALADLCRAHGLDDVSAVLDRWAADWTPPASPRGPNGPSAA